MAKGVTGIIEEKDIVGLGATDRPPSSPFGRFVQGFAEGVDQPSRQREFEAAQREADRVMRTKEFQALRDRVLSGHKVQLKKLEKAREEGKLTPQQAELQDLEEKVKIQEAKKKLGQIAETPEEAIEAEKAAKESTTFGDVAGAVSGVAADLVTPSAEPVLGPAGTPAPLMGPGSELGRRMEQEAAAQAPSPVSAFAGTDLTSLGMADAPSIPDVFSQQGYPFIPAPEEVAMQAPAQVPLEKLFGGDQQAMARFTTAEAKVPTLRRHIADPMKRRVIMQMLAKIGKKESSNGKVSVVTESQVMKILKDLYGESASDKPKDKNTQTQDRLSDLFFGGN